MNPLRKLDDVLNRITMYRLTLYGLLWIVSVSVILNAVGVLTSGVLWPLLGLGALSVGCGVSNQILSRLYRVPISQESSIITTLILFLILKPAHTWFDLVAYVVVGLIAMVSKFALTYRRSVIVNPAAFAVLVGSLATLSIGGWWVASKYLAPAVLVAGLLIVRKTRQFSLLLSFIVPAFVLLVWKDVSPYEALVSYPLIFLGTIMLTEPATMPAGHTRKLLYGVLVGVLVGWRPEILGHVVGPAEALLLGNLLSVVMSRKSATRLIFRESNDLTPTTSELVFEPEQPVRFRAGQYAELTLGTVPLFASRGNRRTFTLASSPSDQHVRIGVKFYEPSSAYKQSLRDLKPGDHVALSHLGGDFIIDRARPSLCLAGGIGITPFISTVREAVEKGDKLDMTIIYFVSDRREIAYRDILTQAHAAGAKVVVIDDPAVRLTDDYLDKLGIKRPDTNAYVSGPPAMVRSYKRLLRCAGMRSVRTDYFSGY
jgi:ferredoxin-NADP reductase